MNTPIQGSAADIIKLAMVKFSEKIKETKYHAKLLLQVHDELIFEIPKSEVEDFSKFVEEIMEQALVLDVPLKVLIMVQHGTMLNKERIISCLNYLKLNMLKEVLSH